MNWRTQGKNKHGFPKTSPRTASVLRNTAPAGYTKNIEALKQLLRQKEFSAITWAEIATTAGVNEALIYKYFRDRNYPDYFQSETCVQVKSRVNTIVSIGEEGGQPGRSGPTFRLAASDGSSREAWNTSARPRSSSLATFLPICLPRKS